MKTEEENTWYMEMIILLFLHMRSQRYTGLGTLPTAAQLASEEAGL